MLILFIFPPTTSQPVPIARCERQSTKLHECASPTITPDCTAGSRAMMCIASSAVCTSTTAAPPPVSQKGPAYFRVPALYSSSMCFPCPLRGCSLAGRPDRLRSDSRSDPIVHRIEAFVAKNLGRPIRVGELAVLSNMSVRTLIRHFHKVTGVTPLGFVQTTRMSQAKTLLANSRQPIKSVTVNNWMHSRRVIRKLSRKTCKFTCLDLCFAHERSI